MSGRRELLDFAEMRSVARRNLPRAIFDYIDRGTEGETALAALRDAFDRRRIVQRALRDARAPDLSVEIFGKRHRHPLIIAPTALAGLVRYDGEITLARAAALEQLPYCAATQASTRLQDIVSAVPQGDIWFQLYPWIDRHETFRLMRSVGSAGVKM